VSDVVDESALLGDDAAVDSSEATECAVTKDCEESNIPTIVVTPPEVEVDVEMMEVGEPATATESAVDSRGLAESSGATGSTPPAPEETAPKESWAEAVEAAERRNKRGSRRRPCPVCDKDVPRIRHHIYTEHLPGCMKVDLITDVSVLPTAPSILFQFLMLIINRMMLVSLEQLLKVVQERKLHPTMPAQLNEREKAQVRAFAEHTGERNVTYDIHKPSCLSILSHWRLLARIIGTLSSQDQRDVRNFVPTGTKSNGSSKKASDVSTEVPRQGVRRPASDDWRGGPGIDMEVQPEAKVPRMSGPGTADTLLSKGERFSTKTSTVAKSKKITVTLKGSDQRRVSSSKPAFKPFVGVDTHFHPDMIMQRTGKSTLEEALSVLPTSKEFKLSKAICIFCFPGSYPDPRQRIQLRQDP